MKTPRLGLQLSCHLNRSWIINQKKLVSRCRHDIAPVKLDNQQTKILASIESGFKAEPIQELPPDAKTQAKTAFRQIGLVLRAVVYSVMGLGVTAVVGFLGVHAWVEYLELPPPGKFERTRLENNPFGWHMELMGWGAGFMGGGTDPSIGWRARSLIRAAWVAQQWQSGQEAVQVQDHDPSAPEEKSSRLVDSAYLTAQSLLREAISMVKKSKPHQEEASLDPALFELESCLANILERIHTRSSLKEAYQIYSKQSNAFIHSIDRLTRVGHPNDDWKVVHTIRTIEKLLKVGLQIIDLERSTNASGVLLVQEESGKKLIWAVNRVLGIPTSEDQCQTNFPDNLQGDSSKPSGFLSSYNWFGNSQENSTNGSSGGLNGDSLNLTTKLAPIHERLSQVCSQEELYQSQVSLSSPLQQRLIISSLLKLSTYLVSVNSLKNALGIQEKLLELIQVNLKKVTDHQHVQAPRLKDGSLSDEEFLVDKKLHEYWLNSRMVLSNIYLTQIQQEVLKNKKFISYTGIQRSSKDNPQIDQKEIIQKMLGQLEDELANYDSSTQPSILKYKNTKLARSLAGRLSENFVNMINDLKSIDSIVSS